ncbi:MAG: hypothetical protein QM809_10675 [Gordonia sp. (in: high G+C Gram-positive bacteria)]|uniref:hypothetical protein n=1 Tax=Gordonia sp. (in: high G+C Gram-positive bacteria) TaxID=84139 RepID=UPI0039E6E60D
MLAEFLVGTVLGCIPDDETRLEWDAYDLRTRDGIRVEVKSTAHLQSWGTTKRSSLRFGINPTLAWDAKSNTYDTEVKRQADVYVFCEHHERNRIDADPLDVDQWTFYVLSADVLDRLFPGQKSIALPVVQQHADRCDYRSLKRSVERLVPNSERDGR